VVLAIGFSVPAIATAAERYAVIVSGASGGGRYAMLQEQWRGDLAETLKTRFSFSRDNIVILDEDREGTARATAENVRRLLADLRRRMTADDTLLIVLFGHGTIDGTDAKFNLVGPDLTAMEWKAIVEPMPGRLVIVNTTESSFPFLDELSRKGRIVITATDSTAQRFATTFPDAFVKALAEPGGDLDKDGRLSIWEAFIAASARVRTYYEQRGQLSTEHPLLDDDGDRVGKEADAPGEDGALARAVFLDPPRGATTGDAELIALEQQRDRLQKELADLRLRKPLLSDEEYAKQLETLLLQLSRVSAQIRSRS
jgi:hypothetical protein